MIKAAAIPVWFLLTVRLAAQLPDGSVAPDFYATDLSGQSWHLYEQLDQGKTVLLEMGATSCLPCWAYYNGGHLAGLYNEYGPPGEDRLRVFMVESDPASNTACLYGPSGCNAATLGNWVAGTPYPILDNASIAATYQTAQLPNLVLICPNRKAYKVGQWNAAQLLEAVETCPVASGANNGGIFYFRTGAELDEICDELRVAPSFQLINLGANLLSAATVELQWDNTTVQTLQWNGSLPLYGEATLAFDTLALDEPGLLTVALTAINNSAGDEDYSNNVRQTGFTSAGAFSTQKVVLQLRTDGYGAETYWEIRDDADGVVDFGGNQAVGSTGGGMFPTGIGGGPGAYGNSLLIRDTIEMPADGCYSLHFVDAYGDGLCCSYGNGYYRLYNLGDPLTPILSGGQFTSYDRHGFRIGEPVSSAGEPTALLRGLHLFPNPARDFLNLETELPAALPVRLTAINPLGQIIFGPLDETWPPGEHRRQIPVSHWPSGFYWLQVQAGSEQAVRKVWVNGGW